VGLKGISVYILKGRLQDFLLVYLVVKRDAQIIEKRENGCGARESSIPLIFDSLRKAKFFLFPGYNCTVAKLARHAFLV
jgi:hypothetical protein